MSSSVRTIALCTLGMVSVFVAGCSSEPTKTAEVKSNGGSYVVHLARATSSDIPHYSKASVQLSNASQDSRITNYAVMSQHATNPNARRKVTDLDRVVWNAQKQQGKMYRYGAENPAVGFDCSGLTQFAFGQGAGVSIPRTAAAQYSAATKVSPTQAVKGDLVFFRTRGSRVSHVGIYLGDGKFVHAPRTGRAITTEKLDGYWAQRLVGFGRIPGACKASLS